MSEANDSNYEIPDSVNLNNKRDIAEGRYTNNSNEFHRVLQCPIVIENEKSEKLKVSVIATTSTSSDENISCQIHIQEGFYKVDTGNDSTIIIDPTDVRMFVHSSGFANRKGTQLENAFMTCDISPDWDNNGSAEIHSYYVQEVL